MNHDQFNHYCESFAGASYVMQWGGSHVWKVAGKVFAIGFTLKDGNSAYTFKTSDRNYYFLQDSHGYRPAPYFANRGMKWIQQTDTRAELDKELEYYLSESYRIVLEGVSKRKRSQLGLL
ncbi:MmcQ/YjbR family DNA-binding protein [Vibrio gallicus]|uniref:MmcQ/YjbR family DNA-binding protein n=1 Tax=Vibrio gallicus TaxID=190897 RepID=UPI0021C351F2|nr:MmcQ/YjbR family DNA-binding protein [Vibrio gallicus]